MANNFNEKEVIELVKKELQRYFNKETNFDKKIEEKKMINFIGENNILREELNSYAIISELATTLVIGKLSLKNLFNLSNAIYENEFEEKIIKNLFENKEVILLEEALEINNYENIPIKMKDLYDKYINTIKTFGVKINSKEKFINHLASKEEMFNSKLLDFNKIKDLKSKGYKKITVSKQTIITASAFEFAKEEGIDIIRGR